MKTIRPRFSKSELKFLIRCLRFLEKECEFNQFQQRGLENRLKKIREEMVLEGETCSLIQKVFDIKEQLAKLRKERGGSLKTYVLLSYMIKRLKAIKRGSNTHRPLYISEWLSWILRMKSIKQSPNNDYDYNNYNCYNKNSFFSYCEYPLIHTLIIGKKFMDYTKLLLYNLIKNWIIF